MARRTKIKWNLKGFEEIRTSPKVVAHLEERAQSVAAAAGPGFEAKPVEIIPGARQGARARIAVTTTDVESTVRNSRDHTLVRALSAAEPLGYGKPRG